MVVSQMVLVLMMVVTDGGGCDDDSDSHQHRAFMRCLPLNSPGVSGSIKTWFLFKAGSTSLYNFDISFVN